MPTLHIASAVSEKTGTVKKGFSFIVMGGGKTNVDMQIWPFCCFCQKAKVVVVVKLLICFLYAYLYS